MFTEVKRQWARLVQEWVTASVHYTHVSDGFVASAGRSKPQSALFNKLFKAQSIQYIRTLIAFAYGLSKFHPSMSTLTLNLYQFCCTFKVYVMH